MALAPTYPAVGVGDLETADYLAAFLPGLVVKPALTSRNTTTTYAADPDLASITLAVGTWKIELVLFFTFTGGTTQKIKTNWGFSGTWNNPIRACFGPGANQVAARDAATESQFGAYTATGQDAIYNALNGSSYVCAREVSATAVVTVAGDLSLNWAQVVSSANATIVQPGSYFEVRQIG